MKLPGLQNFINKVYRHPKAEKMRIKRFGGKAAYNNMLSAEQDMKLAAFKLNPVNSYHDGLPVTFLTGKNYLYQTLFCIASLVKNTSERFKFIIVDDGSFDSGLIDAVNILLPGLTLITAPDIESRLDTLLPQTEYPVIRKKRLVYPHLKKLTDIHSIAGDDWKLVLDSDMLFMNEPKEIISWLKNPNVNLFMKDCQQSYGYSDILMKQLCGFNIPEKLNVGVSSMQSSFINWEKIEYWIQQLEAAEGTTYYLEQALTAMLAAGRPITILPEHEYIVYPDATQINKQTGILHHYVDLSKKEYFTHSWKQFV